MIKNRFLQIKLSKLVLWEDNPRLAILDSNIESTAMIIEKIYKLSPTSFKNIANDIFKEGLVKSDLPIVIHDEDTGTFRVYEGNRRVAAIKALYNPNVMKFNKSVVNYFKKLNNSLDKVKVPFKIDCYVADSEETAFRYVERLHSGEDAGRGRQTWGHLQKEKYKELQNSKLEKQKKISPAFILSSNYDSLTKIIGDLAPSNINRILQSKKLKETLEISTFENLNGLQIKLLENLFFETARQSNDAKLPISRVFHNVSDIESRLIPFIENQKELLLQQDEYSEIKKKIVFPELKLKSEFLVTKTTDSVNLMTNLTNYDSFTKVDISVKTLDESTSLPVENYILQSSQNPGKYMIVYEGFVGEFPAHKKTIELEILPFVPKPRAIAKRFYILDTSGYKINISNAINSIITEINSLNFDTHPMVITSSLRFLVEESLKVVFNIQSWSFTGRTLDSKIEDLKLNCTHAVRTSIDTKTNMGYHAISNFLDALDSQNVSTLLNAITHTPNSLPKAQICDLAKTTLSKLLIIFTGLCN